MWYATWLVGRRGISTMVNVLVGEVRQKVEERAEVRRELESYLADEDIPAYVEAVVNPSFQDALSLLLQTRTRNDFMRRTAVSSKDYRPPCPCGSALVFSSQSVRGRA